MTYVPITYIPDGPVTSRLKDRVKGRTPPPDLGNLGPMLDENLSAAKKRGYFLYRPDDLRRLKGVDRNPEVVDVGFDVLRETMAEKGIPEPTAYRRSAPYYPDTRRLIGRTIALAAAMTIGITVAVVLGQNDHVTAMTVAIVLISVLGAALFGVVLRRTVIRVEIPNDVS